MCSCPVTGGSTAAQGLSCLENPELENHQAVVPVAFFPSRSLTGMHVGFCSLPRESSLN